MSARDELAGRLTERVTIERQAGGRDALAGADGTWSVIATRWAAVVPDGFGEVIVGEAASASARFRVTLRRGVAVRLGDRLGWDGHRLRVRAIVEDPAMRDRIALLVEEMR